MKQSGFKPKPIGFNSTFKKCENKPLKRTRMTNSRPKTSKIRQSAKNQECTLLLPGCLYTTETTVLCHSNLLSDGRGMGIKAPDTRAAYGCRHCHDLLDGRAPLPRYFTEEELLNRFELAVIATHEILRERGLIE